MLFKNRKIWDGNIIIGKCSFSLTVFVVKEVIIKKKKNMYNNVICFRIESIMIVIVKCINRKQSVMLSRMVMLFQHNDVKFV